MTAAATNEIESSESEAKETNDNENSTPLINKFLLPGNDTDSATTENRTKKLYEIFKYLSESSVIIFKSQQIDDPEISVEEKFGIAKNLFKECHLKFLRKFGQYLNKEHLIFLQETIAPQNEDYEANFLFKNLLLDIEHRQSNIKNRRFTVMKKMLLEQNEYFSESEMMKREPLLYEQLVGQYLTEREKNIRDGYNPKTTLFSQILLDNYDRDQYDKLRKQQELVEVEIEESIDDDEDVTQDSFTSSKITHNSGENCSDEEMFPKIPPSFRKQWGNFDDEEDNDVYKRFEKTKPGTSVHNLKRLGTISKMKRNKKLDAKQKYVTAGEREMLRQEFLSIMRSKFVDGSDTEFDYSGIDNNIDLDDLDQINQDCEDKYFDDDLEDCKIHSGVNENFDSQNESDDDLDIYMKNLNKKVNKRQKL